MADELERPGQVDDDRPSTIEQPEYGDPADDISNLLSLDPRKAGELAYRLWKDQPKEPIERRRAEWKVNNWRREGRTNVYVQKVQDKGLWTAWAPPWSAPPTPILNKADRLCRRLKNIMFADPPVPEAVPSTSDEEDVEAARLGERILTDIQSEANLDDIRTARRAFDRASVYGSGFIRYYIDPHGGGRQPVKLMAKPGAVRADAPFSDAMGQPLPGEPIARYVTPDGRFTENASEAATRWMPALKREILQASSIRFLPHDSEDIWDADGIILGTMPTWGEVKRDFAEELEALNITDDERTALFAFKPEHATDLRGLDTPSKKEDDSTREDDKRVALFTIYYKACPLYPNGCYVVGLADKVALIQKEWVYKPEEGDPEPLEIPVTQYAQFDAGRPDPFQLGLMHLLGNGNELRASQVGHLLQFLDQFAGRRTYLPTNSIIQPKQLQLMKGEPIPINPGGQPIHEEIPNFPREPLELFALTTQEMDDHSMLQETAQGTDVSHITSGRQQAQVVQQAMASLSEIRQNVERAYIRGCRIQAQLIRMGYTIPQQISWTGEDGQYRQQWWSGSDLRGTADFKLKQGSLSMMTPEAKMNMAMAFKQMGVYDQNPDLFYDALTSTLGPVVGLQDDPSRNRIKRQLALWAAGPPEGWAPPLPPEAAAAGAVAPLGGLEAPGAAMGGLGGPPGAPPVPLGGPATATGAPVPAGSPAPGPGLPGAPGLPGQPLQPSGSGGAAPADPLAQGGGPIPGGVPAPPDPALAAIFEPIPADELPDIAAIRLTELKRFMASTRFTRWPPGWRAGVIQEFEHMKLCAGVQSIPEQMAQQQAAEQAAAQQAQAQADQQFQQQLALESARAEKQNGARKPLNLKVDRDPTGRMAGVREAGSN